MRKLSFAAALIAFLLPAPAFGQATFTVNATDDTSDGLCDASHCSLREAIDTANASPGTDSIAFNLAGAAPFVIGLNSALPAITDPVIIDGATQPGFALEAIIEIDGTSAGAGADGLHISAGASAVRYLAIHSFAGDGIVVDTNGGNRLEGVVVGTDFKVLVCDPNGGAGVVLASSGNVVGGSASQLGSVIVCSGGDGIRITADSNSVLSSAIGTDFRGIETLDNGGDGIRIDGAGSSFIGGPEIVTGNKIYNSGGAGIRLVGTGTNGNFIAGNTVMQNAGKGIVLMATAGTGNLMKSNEVPGNGTMAIDLGDDGVTPNDPGDTDTGPNNLQNYPVLGSAINLLPGLQVRGTLNSTPNTTFTLQFFAGNDCGAAGHREARLLIDSATVTTDAGGDASFTTGSGTAVTTGQQVSATATDPAGNTSELSACQPIVSYGLGVIPDSVTVRRGSIARYAIDVTALGGTFDDPVALSCDSLPGATNCTFSQDTVTPGSGTARSILDVETTLIFQSAGAPTPAGPAGPAGPAPAGAALLLGLAGLALLALAAAARAPRRRRRFAFVMGLALLGAGVYTGCSSSTEPPVTGGTPLGRHEFQIVATSGPAQQTAKAILIVE